MKPKAGHFLVSMEMPDVIRVLDNEFKIQEINIDRIACSMSDAGRKIFVDFVTKNKILEHVFNTEIGVSAAQDIKEILFDFFTKKNQERLRLLQNQKSQEVSRLAKELGIEVEAGQTKVDPQRRGGVEMLE